MANDELLHGVVLLFAILFPIISEDTDFFLMEVMSITIIDLEY